MYNKLGIPCGSGTKMVGKMKQSLRKLHFANKQDSVSGSMEWKLKHVCKQSRLDAGKITSTERTEDGW